MNRIQLRRGTHLEWETVNPILAQGEPGLTLDDPEIMKIGNAVDDWITLPVFMGTASAVVFTKVFPDTTSDLILDSEHGLPLIRDAKVLKSTGEQIDVYFEYRPDNSLFIDSNITLLNHTLKLF